MTILEQMLISSILGRDPDSIQVLRKSVEMFLCYPADKATNQPTTKPPN